MTMEKTDDASRDSRRSVSSRWIIRRSDVNHEVVDRDLRIGLIAEQPDGFWLVQFFRVERELDWRCVSFSQCLGYVRGVERATQVYGREMYGERTHRD